jgi:putative Holliday junction resolvase
MAIINIDDLKALSGPLLGLDPGTKTLGLAVSDRTRMIATPVKTIQRRKFSLDGAELLKIYDHHEASALIVGYPLNMDGSHGPRTQSVRDFCQNLMKLRDIPIYMWDERLSTLAVTRTMITADMSRKKRKDNVDKLAASYILQGVLDRLRN